MMDALQFLLANPVFCGAAFIAVFSTVMCITNLNPVHALLYLIVSLLALAVIFFTLGAPFAAMLEVIVYAGAIMVLFIFVVMMLNLGEATVEQERAWLSPGAWVGPGVLAFLLLGLLATTAFQGGGAQHAVAGEVGVKAVGIALYGPYLLAVELASMLLLAGLVAAYHLGRYE